MRMVCGRFHCSAHYTSNRTICDGYFEGSKPPKEWMYYTLLGLVTRRHFCLVSIACCMVCRWINAQLLSANRAVVIGSIPVTCITLGLHPTI